MGDASDLARRVKPALDLMGKGEMPPAPTPISFDAADLDTSALDAIVKKTGDKMGKVYKYTIGRDDLHITDMGAKINARMGLNTWAAFYGTDADSVVAGDVAMLDNEVTPVLKVLRNNHIEVVALHHHMTGTKPTIYFLHYWGRGKASALASAFREVLDVLGSRPMRSTHAD
jgi:hypothetical protein